MESLGYMNGWTKIPEIVIKCKEQEHEKEKRNIGRCLNQYSCKECGYYYNVDSGD